MSAMINTTMVNWAVSGTAILLVVLMLRRLFGERISRRMRYGLWLVVLVRLLVPFSFGDSGLSIQNWLPAEMVQIDENESLTGDRSGDLVLGDNSRKDMADISGNVLFENTQNNWQEPQNGISQENSQQATGQPTKESPMVGQSTNGQPADGQATGSQPINGQPVNGQIGSTQQNTAQDSQENKGSIDAVNMLSQILPTLLQVWRIGAVLGIAWVLVVNGRFALHLKRTRRKVGEYLGMTVYTASDLVSPCLFGLWQPAIYLTTSVAEQEAVRFYAIRHEGCHYSHGDHVWGVLRGVCLAIWWWNPLVWLAAGMSRQDCEMACDEACVEALGEICRQEYGMALVRSLQELAGGTGRQYPGTAATLFSGKKELKVRLYALTKRPVVRYSAIALVTVTIFVGIMITFTGQAAGNDEGGSKQQDWMTGEIGTEEIYIKESSSEGADPSEEPGEPETMEPVVEMQPSGLTDTVQIYTQVFPWDASGVKTTEAQGEEIGQLAVPVFAKDCSYYINKIHYNNHGIDYQETDEQTFLTTVEGLEEKGYNIGMEVVYEQGQIVEAYLKSDQAVWTNLFSGQEHLSWDPEHPPYEYTGLEAYTLEREYVADISDVEGLETIGIYTVRINDGYDAELVVRDARGNVLYAKNISTHEKEREGIFLVEENGVPALLWWEASERYNFAIQYTYWVFRLDEMGIPKQSTGAVYLCMFLKYLGHSQYDPGQLVLWGQPLYDKYLKKGEFLAGFDSRISSEIYYEIRDLNAYHPTTLQAETEAAHAAYWYDHPEAMYVDADFEEYATIQALFEENNRLWMQLKGKTMNASVSSNCHFYIRQEIDQYPYEEIEQKEFMEILDENGETYVHLQYENGWIINVFLDGLHEGISFYNPFVQAVEGCRYVRDHFAMSPAYGETLSDWIQSDWTQYQLEAQYQVDVSDYEGRETISIYSGPIRDMPTEEVVLLKVESAEGKILFLDQLDHFGFAKTSYYLGERDGQKYLVLLYREDRYSHGEFHYNAFRLDKNMTQLSGCRFVWSVDASDEASVFPEESFRLWASKAQYYLEGAECILHVDTSGVGESEFQYDWDGVIDWQAYAKEIKTRD